MSTTQIRDPIHGTVEVDDVELAVIDHPLFQRLRNVKQLGFGDQAFPGATHSRYAHSLGAAHVAGRVFGAIFGGGNEHVRHGDQSPTALSRGIDLAPKTARRFRRALRLAVLMHDIGHPPLSHSSERGLPPRRALGLERWLDACALEGRADHEDYTLKIALDSDLARRLDALLEADGLSSASIAYLITGKPAAAGAAFVDGGLDYGPILRQVVSSELDADRMDYLLRDSLYSGVAYGRYDMDWLLPNMTAWPQGQSVYLGVSSRAIFAFEDFLLSRYHMFVSVYLHYKSVCYDHLLGRYFEDAPGEYSVPTDAERFAQHDDVKLWNVLRESKSEWARRITERQPFKLLIETNPMDQALDRASLTGALRGAGIDIIEAHSKGEISKYFGQNAAAPIFVVPTVGATKRIEDYTPLYKRYGEKLGIYRIYCDPARQDDAKKILQSLGSL